MLIQSAAVFKKLRLISRSFFVLLVMLSFFSLSVSVPGGGKYILLYDCSDSVTQGELRSEHLKSVFNLLQESAQTDLFLFGGNAVEISSLADLDLARKASDPGRTDIRDALRKAVNGRKQDSRPVEVNPGGLTELAVLVDTSGSMAKEVDGARKIDILRKSLPVIIQFLHAEDVISMAGFSSSVTPLFEHKKRAELMTSVEFKSLGREGGRGSGLDWSGLPPFWERVSNPFATSLLFPTETPGSRTIRIYSAG